MAKKPIKDSGGKETKVTKIKASDTKPKTKTPDTKKPVKTTASSGKKTTEKATKPNRNPFRAIGHYFKGAWYEIKQVRWTNRKATWGLTAAVLLYTAFFVALIIGLDQVFSKLLEALIG